MNREIKNRRCLAAALAATLVTFGCSRAPDLPDPDDPEVRADAEQLATAAVADLEGRDGNSGGPQGEWTCTGELFGRDGAALLGVVSCTGKYDGVPEGSGVSAPVRVTGGRVTWAADGSEHADSIREMWGEELARVYLDRR